MEIKLRKARPEDKEKTEWVESLSTPTLSYVPEVWDMFINDKDGDWSVEEVDGEVVACGKYSILPDGTAWLDKALDWVNASMSTGLNSVRRKALKP